MRLLKYFLAVTLAVTFVAAPEASAQRGRNAQTASVIIIDFARIIEASDIGRSMTTQLNQIGQQMQAELQPEATALAPEEQSIREATQNMTPDQVRANRTLNARVEAFSQRYQQFNTRRTALQRDMEYTRQTTLNAFNEQIQPTVRAVMEARGAGVVLDGGGVYLWQDSINATDDVIQRLNQSLRTMTVSRQSAPTQQQGNAG